MQQRAVAGALRCSCVHARRCSCIHASDKMQSHIPLRLTPALDGHRTSSQAIQTSSSSLQHVEIILGCESLAVPYLRRHTPARAPQVRHCICRRPCVPCRYSCIDCSISRFNRDKFVHIIFANTNTLSSSNASHAHPVRSYRLNVSLFY